MSKFILFSILLCIILSINTAAQDGKANLLVTGNAGGTMQSGSYMIDFTVGEVITELFQTETVMLTQGFHQAIAETISTDQGIVSGVEDVKFNNTELSVFPNPFKTILNIYYSFEHDLDLDISVYDITGKKVLNFAQNYGQGTQQLDLSSYPRGVYFIKFCDQESQKLRTFKIIKS